AQSLFYRLALDKTRITPSQISSCHPVWIMRPELLSAAPDSSTTEALITCFRDSVYCWIIKLQQSAIFDEFHAEVELLDDVIQKWGYKLEDVFTDRTVIRTIGDLTRLDGDANDVVSDEEGVESDVGHNNGRTDISDIDLGIGDYNPFMIRTERRELWLLKKLLAKWGEEPLLE